MLMSDIDNRIKAQIAWSAFISACSIPLGIWLCYVCIRHEIKQKRRYRNIKVK